MRYMERSGGPQTAVLEALLADVHRLAQLTDEARPVSRKGLLAAYAAAWRGRKYSEIPGGVESARRAIDILRRALEGAVPLVSECEEMLAAARHGAEYRSLRGMDDPFALDRPVVLEVWTRLRADALATERANRAAS